MNVTDETITRQWIADTATPLTAPGSLAALDEIVGDAVVTGFGESTRAGHEIMTLGLDVLRHLVTAKGYRALALSDDRSVIAELDEYVRTGTGDVKAILANAFIAVRIDEMVDIVEWIRSHNRDHAEDPVRLFGLEPAAVRINHYDEVIEAVKLAAPALTDAVASRYEVIRTAHSFPEHVQTARGVHPGTPFAELGRAAYDLVAALDGFPAADLARRIAEHHEHTVAAGFDFDAQFRGAARGIIDWHASTGHKVLFWEGLAHVANATTMGFKHFGDQPGFANTTGSLLREHFGDGYRTLAVGFDHGTIHEGVEVPAPPADFADTVLGSAEPDRYLVDLRADRPEAVTRWLSGQHKLRIIAGIYKPDEDADHYVSGPLGEWFDAVIRVREITPTTRW